MNRRLYPEHPIVGVGVLIEQENKFLLIKRASDPDKGLWSIPGGLVELGEKAKDAAIREVHEETGLIVDIIDRIGVMDKIIPDEDNRIKYHFIIIDFKAKVRGGCLQPLDDASDAIWVEQDNFNKYELTPTLKKLLQDLSLMI